MALVIRNLVISPPLALAPMVGLSHSALRSLLAEIGGVGLMYTEMLSAKRLPNETAQSSPLLIRDERERPLFYQIFASEHCDISRAAARLSQLGADGIDLNLGCPAPQLRKVGAGKFLMERFETAVTVVRKLRSSTILPISVKIRIGELPDGLRLLEVCRRLEQEGIDLITVHARLNGEKFCRKPRWEILSDLNGKLSIPIFANGGIFNVEDAYQCMERSGADGLMIGRGAARTPWLFNDIATSLFGQPGGAQHFSKEKLYYRYMDMLCERFPVERRLGRMKQFTHYYASTLEFGHSLATVVQNSGSMIEAKERAVEFFNQYNDIDQGRKQS